MLQLDLLTSRLLNFTNHLYDSKERSVVILITVAIVGRIAAFTMGIFQLCLLPFHATMNLINRTIRVYDHGIMPAFSSSSKRHFLNICQLMLSVPLFELLVMINSKKDEESRLTAYLNPYLDDFRFSYPLFPNDLHLRIKRIFDCHELESFENVEDSLQAGIRPCIKRQMLKGKLRPFGDVHFACVEVAAQIAKIIYEKLLERSRGRDKQNFYQEVSILLPSIVDFTYKTQQSIFERLFDKIDVVDRYAKQAEQLFKQLILPEVTFESVFAKYLSKAKEFCIDCAPETSEDISALMKMDEMTSIALVNLALDLQFYQQDDRTVAFLFHANCPELQSLFYKDFLAIIKDLEKIQKSLKSLSFESIVALKKQIYLKKTTIDSPSEQKIQEILVPERNPQKILASERKVQEIFKEVWVVFYRHKFALSKTISSATYKKICDS